VPPAAPPAPQTIATRPQPTGGDLAFYGDDVVLAAEYSEGPLPSARELQRYRRADPSAPDIILKEFRAEAKHRRHLERAIVNGENRRADRGQVFALIILLVGLSYSALLIYGGHDLAGELIGSIDLLGMGALFLGGISAVRGHGTRKNPEKAQLAG